MNILNRFAVSPPYKQQEEVLLGYGKYNSTMLKKLIRTKINNQFSKIGVPRCLYADSSLLQILNFVYDFKFTTEINCGKIYELEKDREAMDIDSATNVVFFIYPDPEIVPIIGSMIQKNQAKFTKKNYYLFFVPSNNYLCSEALQSLNISEKIQINHFNFDFIPMNQDMFSLQFSKYLDQVQQNRYIAQSLLRMSNIMGKFKAFFGLGSRTEKILKNMQQQQDQIPQIRQLQQNQYLIMLDRNIDYITPMMTAFTYQGLLDLFFGINLNKIQVPGHLIDSKQPLQTFLLYNPRDKHYETISRMYIKEVPQYLKKQSQALGNIIKQKKQQAKTLQALNQINQTLMSQFIILQYHKSIVTFILTHINQCPFINTATLQASVIQTCQRSEQQALQYLSIFYPIQQVFKLQILASQVSQFGSYYARFEKTINQTILQSYHPQHLLTVHNLVQKSILKNSRIPLKWKQICEKYDLIPDQSHKYTFVHIIYSALLVRFVQMFLTDNLNNQTIGLLSNKSIKYGSFSKIKKGDRVYIYIVGGITYPQVQCFRILGEKIKIKFVILTTQVTSGQKIIKKCF